MGRLRGILVQGFRRGLLKSYFYFGVIAKERFIAFGAIYCAFGIAGFRKEQK